MRPSGSQVRHIPDRRKAAKIFREVFEIHHYLKGNVVSNGFFFLVRHGPFPIGMVVSGIQFGAEGKGAKPITFREARLVVLPSYQGYGIGPRLSAVRALAGSAVTFKELGGTGTRLIWGWLFK